MIEQRIDGLLCICVILLTSIAGSVDTVHCVIIVKIGMAYVSFQCKENINSIPADLNYISVYFYFVSIFL